MNTPTAGSAAGIDLARLEQLARAADQGEGQHIYTHPRDSNNWRANANWHRAADPATILTLIALARATPQPSADRAPADGAGELVYQVRMPGASDSTWNDATESAYHTFTEAHRRIVRIDRAPTAGDSATQQPALDWISNVVRDVAELPDRDSPEGQPDMMLVTVNELHDIIAQHAPAATPQHSVAEQADERRTYETAQYMEEKRADFAAAFKVDIWAVQSWLNLNGFDPLRKYVRRAQPLTSTAVTQPEQAVVSVMCYGNPVDNSAASGQQAEVSDRALAGRIVSVDVSTGDDDAGNRIFAALDGDTGSDGTTLLAIETSRNFGSTTITSGAAKEWNRRATPPVGDDGLPPLAALKGPFADYSAEEVEAYAKYVQREAYEAGRRAAVPAQTGTQPAGDSIPPEDDRPERDWKKWIAGRAGLGPGAAPERIFFAGWFAGRRAAVSTAGAPDGWKLVPLEPTDKMTAIGQGLRYISVNSIGEIYRQMLAAAPSSPAE